MLVGLVAGFTTDGRGIHCPPGITGSLAVAVYGGRLGEAPAPYSQSHAPYCNHGCSFDKHEKLLTRSLHNTPALV